MGTASNRAFASAAERSPRNWVTFADWAAHLGRQNQPRAMQLALARAAELNPRENRVRILQEALVK